MNILFGITGTGFGHLMCGSVLLKRLLKRGHHVIVLTFGNGPTYFSTHFPEVEVIESPIFHWHSHREGIDFRATAEDPTNRNPDTFPSFYRAFAQVQQHMGRPDLVLSDFEMIAAQCAYIFDSPLVTVGRYGLFAGYEHPSFGDATPHFTQMLYRLVFPRANIHLAPLFFKVDHPHIAGRRVQQIPPVLRPSILEANADEYDPRQILVYLSLMTPDAAEQILTTLQQFPEYQFVVFRKDALRSTQANVRFEPIDPKRFVHVLTTSSAIIASAGTNLPAEAAYLRKPYFAIPNGEYEQLLNASYIERAGMGQSAGGLTQTNLQQFLDTLDRYRTAYEGNPWLWEQYNGEQVILDYLANTYGV